MQKEVQKEVCLSSQRSAEEEESRQLLRLLASQTQAERVHFAKRVSELEMENKFRDFEEKHNQRKRSRDKEAGDKEATAANPSLMTPPLSL